MLFLSGSAEAVHLDPSLLVVMALFILYHLVMKSLFYKPFFKVLQKRDSLTKGKMEEALRTEEEYSALVEKYENSIREARQKGYKLIEESRRSAVEEQNKKIAQIQEEIQQKLQSSKKEIEDALSREKKVLDKQVFDLGRLIASKILARELRS